jgi:hypothetical protein
LTDSTASARDRSRGRAGAVENLLQATKAALVAMDAHREQIVRELSGAPDE